MNVWALKIPPFAEEQVSQNLCIMLHVDVDVTMLDDDINKSCKQMYIYLSLAYISISCINIETEKMEQEKKNV